MMTNLISRIRKLVTGFVGRDHLGNQYYVKQNGAHGRERRLIKMKSQAPVDYETENVPGKM